MISGDESGVRTTDLFLGVDGPGRLDIAIIDVDLYFRWRSC